MSWVFAAALRHRRVCVAALVWLAMGVAMHGAWAHASLVSSDPADGAMLAAPPAKVVLRFNEPVSPLIARLIDSAGATRADLVVEAKNETLEIALPSDLPTGTQTLSYRIVSADGHPVGGVVVFSIGAPSGVARTPTSDPFRAFALWSVGFFVRFLLFVGVGGAFFAAFVAPPETNRVLRPLPMAALFASALAVALSIGLQGLDRLDLPLGGLPGIAPWREGLRGGFAWTAAGLVIAAGLAALSLATRLPRTFSLLALLTMGAAMASTGHASTASPAFLTRPALFLHVAIAAVWVGALPPLAQLAALRSPFLPLALRRFSAIAIVGVPVLIVAGVALGWAQMTGEGDFLATAYGRILLAKLAAVAALLSLAGINLLVLTPGVEKGRERARRRVSSTLRGEIALAVVILALVAGWRLTPPPRAIAAQEAGKEEMIHLHGEKMMAMVTLSPGKVGANRAHIDLLGGDFGPLAASEVTLTLKPEDGSIEERATIARVDPAGGYEVDRLFLPFAGAWRLEIDARIDDFTKYELSETREFAN